MKKFSTSLTSRPKQKTSMSECSDCPALCCHDLSVVILRPRTRKEIEDLKWQLKYDTVGVYIRNRRWHQLVKGKCSSLDENFLCRVYADRPDICRSHRPPHCERYDEWYDVLFTTPEQLEAYLARNKAAERNKKR